MAGTTIGATIGAFGGASVGVLTGPGAVVASPTLSGSGAAWGATIGAVVGANLEVAFNSDLGRRIRGWLKGLKEGAAIVLGGGLSDSQKEVKWPSRIKQQTEQETQEGVPEPPEPPVDVEGEEEHGGGGS